MAKTQQRMLKQKALRRHSREELRKEERFKNDLEREIRYFLFQIILILAIFLLSIEMHLRGLGIGFIMMPWIGTLPLFIPKMLVNSDAFMQKFIEKATVTQIEKSSIPCPKK